MEYNAQQIAHEEEVLEEQLIAADPVARYNDENVEVDEANEQYFMDESGIIDVEDTPEQQQHYAQQAQPPAQQHYYPAASQPVRAYPTPRNVSYLQPQQPTYSSQPRAHSSSYARHEHAPPPARSSYGGQPHGFGGSHQYYTVVPATSSFARPPATFQAPVAHIAVNSQSETRLREVNYREQQKPIIRAGVVQNATSLTPTPRKHDRREVLSGSALQGSPLTTYLNFARMTKPRKASKKRPCNCTKSMCLKLYCECFANGEFCLDCNCKDCHNNLENEAERSRAIKASLQRNPNAFKPKIGVATKGADKKDLERLHQKGCHCKKSNCLKNYCECYEAIRTLTRSPGYAKVPCTDRCKCTSCRNTEADRSQKFKDKFSTTGLAQLAAAAAADARAASPFSDEDEDPFASEAIDPKTLPWNYPDVIEATTFCLVAQAHELESKASEEDLERSILQEFGRCLEKMLDIATNAASNNALAASGLPPYA